MDNQPLQKESTMLERLAKVIYWAGCTIAPLAGVYGISETISFFAQENLVIDMPMAFMTGLAYGLPFFLLGLATRYVLIGHGWGRKKP